MATLTKKVNFHQPIRAMPKSKAKKSEEIIGRYKLLINGVWEEGTITAIPKGKDKL